MKKKQEMQYYLRKSAYGLAAVSVAVLAVGSPVAAQEKATETNVSGKEAPKVSKKPSKEIIEKVLKKAGEETKEKESKEKAEELSDKVSKEPSINEETETTKYEKKTVEEESDGLESEEAEETEKSEEKSIEAEAEEKEVVKSESEESTEPEEVKEESEEEKEDESPELETEVEKVEAIEFSEAEGNDSSKPEASEEVAVEEDRQETDRLAEVKTEESAKEGDEDADKKDEVEEKAKKAAELSRVKAEALAKLEALNASRLMKKIVESGKTVEGILSFMKESLPQLEAARASEQAKAPEVTQSPDHLPSEKKAVHNPVQAVKTSESLEQKAENAKTSTNLQNTQSPVQEAKRTQAQLPSTGEDYQAYLVAAAMALIASSGMVAYGSYRKKK